MLNMNGLFIIVWKYDANVNMIDTTFKLKYCYYKVEKIQPYGRWVQSDDH